MDIGVFSADNWLYPDTKIKENSIKVNAVKGSYANVQLIVDGCKGTLEPKIVVDNKELRGDFYELLEVNVNRNSDFFEPLDSFNRSKEVLEKLYTRKAPFYVYDPMKPFSSATEFSGKAALYLSIKIPYEIACGKYDIRIVVGCKNDFAEAYLNLEIYNIALPKQKKLNVANWIEPSEKSYGYEVGNEKFWDVHEKIAKLAIKSGQNCISVSRTFLKCEVTGGKYKFDFSLVERYIKTLLNMGYTRIEGMHITGVYSKFIEPYEKTSVYTERGKECIAEYLSQWYSFIKANGWENITMQHIGDEPRDEGIENYISLIKLCNEYMPNIPTIEAVLTPNVCEYLDIPVPLTRHYQLHKAEYDEACKNADELWLYTCCWPVAPYLNRFLDMPLISPRLVHWLNFATGTSGYLHWGFCAQGSNQDVYKEPAIAFKYMGVPDSEEYLPAGDTNIIYPYNGEPIGSVRLEMVRSGVEDYELLCMLKKKNQGLAEKITSLVINDDWSTDIDYLQLEEIYENLLENISEG